MIKLSDLDHENLNSIIHYYMRAFKDYQERQPIMFQEYLNNVQMEGDVKILLLNGKILGAMRRKPRRGDFRTNERVS